MFQIIVNVYLWEGVCGVWGKGSINVHVCASECIVWDFQQLSLAGGTSTADDAYSFEAPGHI